MKTYSTREAAKMLRHRNDEAEPLYRFGRGQGSAGPERRRHPAPGLEEGRRGAG